MSIGTYLQSPHWSVVVARCSGAPLKLMEWSPESVPFFDECGWLGDGCHSDDSCCCCVLLRCRWWLVVEVRFSVVAGYSTLVRPLFVLSLALLGSFLPFFHFSSSIELIEDWGGGIGEHPTPEFRMVKQDEENTSTTLLFVYCKRNHTASSKTLFYLFTLHTPCHSTFCLPSPSSLPRLVLELNLSLSAGCLLARLHFPRWTPQEMHPHVRPEGQVDRHRPHPLYPCR